MVRDASLRDAPHHEGYRNFSILILMRSLAKRGVSKSPPPRRRGMAARPELAAMGREAALRDAPHHEGLAADRGRIHSVAVAFKSSIEARGTETEWAAMAPERGNAENLKRFSVGSSDSASRRRTVATARAEPFNESFPPLRAGASPA